LQPSPSRVVASVACHGRDRLALRAG